jgi:hypothetical protein
MNFFNFSTNVCIIRLTLSKHQIDINDYTPTNTNQLSIKLASQLSTELIITNVIVAITLLKLYTSIIPV